MIASHYQSRQLLMTFIAETIVSRIKDDSVEVICNALIDEACNYIMLIDRCDTTDIIDNEYATSLGELEIQIFNRIDGFDNNLELVKTLASKRFRDNTSGIDFLVSNNFYAVTNFRDSLYQYLKSSNLKHLSDVVYDFSDGDDELKSKWEEFFIKHPELVC